MPRRPFALAIAALALVLAACGDSDDSSDTAPEIDAVPTTTTVPAAEPSAESDAAADTSSATSTAPTTVAE